MRARGISQVYQRQPQLRTSYIGFQMSHPELRPYHFPAILYVHQADTQKLKGTLSSRYSCKIRRTKPLQRVFPCLYYVEAGSANYRVGIGSWVAPVAPSYGTWWAEIVISDRERLMRSLISMDGDGGGGNRKDTITDVVVIRSESRFEDR